MDDGQFVTGGWGDYACASPGGVGAVSSGITNSPMIR